MNKPEWNCQTPGGFEMRISGFEECPCGTDMNDDLKREARSLIEKIVHLRDSL